MRVLLIILSLFVSLNGRATFSQTLRLDYEGFTVWVDCNRRGPVLFHYSIQSDSGNFERKSSYTLDPSVDSSCQPKSTATFQSVIGHIPAQYDVGHMVPANHFDGSKIAIAQTNFWTNLLPQTRSMNRGAWLQTEEIIECYRDIVPLEVFGGPIWGANFEDDYFIETHGVATPSAFWKIVVRTDNNEGIAWIIPNGEAPRSSIDNWLVGIATLEVLTGRTFEVSNRSETPVNSWEIPSNCDLS